MQPQNVDFLTGHAQPADVGTPQVGNLVWPSYQSETLSDIVAEGRAKSAFNSEQVQDVRKESEAPLEGWSRGCRRAFVSFWFWQWFRLSPLAPRRKNRWNRSPRKSWTPASTSNLAERACRLRQGGPAPTNGAAFCSTEILPKKIECLPRSSYSGRAIFRVSEDFICIEVPSQFLVHWLCWPPAHNVLIPSCPSPSTTSSATSKMSASATDSCATRIISPRFVRFLAARTAANPTSSRPSRLQGNGRSVCRDPRTTIRIRSDRPARRAVEADTSPINFASQSRCLWATASLLPNRPASRTNRRQETC